MRANSPGFDDLLRHARFLQRVARSLVLDDAQSADITQDALILALANPPREPSSLRAWFTRVLQNRARNAAREASRRAERERRAARPEALPSAAETAEREWLLRSVVDAVFSLPEPYRRTVLLRFYEDLGTREIAEREGIEEATVRSRQRRALALLRRRLDRDHGGDRRTWMRTLAPLCGFPRGGGVAVNQDQEIPRLAASDASGLPATIAVGASVLVMAALGWTVLEFAGRREIAREREREEISPVATHPAPSATHPGAPDALAAVDRLPATPAAPAGGETVAALPAAQNSETCRVRVTVGSPPRPAAHVRAAFFEELPLFLDGSDFAHVTDSDGAFAARVAPGNWKLVVDRMVGSRDVVIAEGETTEVSIHLPRGVDVEGTVVDAAGTPVSGAEIVLATRYRTRDSGSVAATSDEWGRFEIASLSRSRFVGARKRGSVPSRMISVEATGREGATSVRLVLPGPGRRVGGVVLGPDLEPVRGARVALEYSAERKIGRFEGGVAMFPPPRRAVTDARGLFEFDDAWLGSLLLLIEPATATPALDDDDPPLGAAPLLLTVEPSGEASEEVVRHVLAPEAAITGLVLRDDGSPVVGVEVAVSDGATCELGAPIVATTSDTGGFFARGIAPGRITLTVRGDGGAPIAEIESEVFPLPLPGPTTLPPIRIGVGPAITGIVVDARGAPIAGIDVIARAPFDADAGPRRPHGSAPEMRAETDADGRFRLATTSAARPHLVRAFEHGHNRNVPIAAALDVVPGGADCVLRVEDASRLTASIRGRIVSRTGEPVRDASIVVLYDGDLSEASVTAAVGDLGDFECQALAARRCRVVAAVRGEGFWQIAHPALSMGEALDLGTIVMPENGSLVVRFQRAPGADGPEPAPVAWVTDEATSVIVPVSIDSNGDGRVENLFPGSALLFVKSAPSGADAATAVPFEIEAGRETALAVSLQRGELRRIEIREAPDRRWASSARVEIRDARGALVHRIVFVRQPDGAISGGVRLAPGRYTMAVTADSGLRGEAAFEIAESGDPAASIAVDLE